jgi:hypothetical protein
MRASRRTIAIVLSIFSLLSFGVVGVVIESAGAVTIPPPPTTVNEAVSISGSLTDAGCPTFTGTAPTPYTSLPAAIAAVSPSNASNLVIYVCAGDYQLYNSSLSAVYGTNQDIVENKPFVTIDGPDWATTPSSSSEAINSASQALIDGGSGMVVSAAHVAINGLTFDGSNYPTDSAYCGNTPTTSSPTGCSTSIDVQSFVSGSGANGAAISGAGDQGESFVSITNNLFVGTGGSGSEQNGDVHFGLGQDGAATLVSALDTNDVVNDNVFFQDLGAENNAVQISDTTGAVVDGNVVNYASVDDAEITALWFPGFDQATQVEGNTLNGGNIDSDQATGCASLTSTNCVNTEDPKSGIKFVDADVYGTYGTGCTDQTVSGNTVSGFVYDIAMISSNANVNSLCAPGPGAFTVTGNTLSNARLYGVFIMNPTTAPGTISSNTVANSDTEYFSGPYFDLVTDTYTTASYIPGDYDYFDQATPSTQTWTTNDGNGFADPSSIGEISNGTPPATTTTTTTATTTTIAPTTTTVAPTTTTAAVPPPATTTTTTIAPKPGVSTSGATLKGASGVATTVFCTSATCSGTLELAKTVTVKVEIGHTKKYRNKSVTTDLGKLGYTVAAGQSERFTIRLNAAGLKLAKAVKGSRYSCTLIITTSAGTTREGVSFKKP